MPATRSDAIVPALEALAVLEALGETVEEDWQYVVDLARAWRLNLENIASDDPVTDEQVGAIAAAAAEAHAHQRRPSGDRLAFDAASAGRRRARGGLTVRFQDAARDARAVVYAGIQADPLVKRAAQVLVGASHAQRLLARATMNGESDDAGAWRSMFPSLFAPDARAADGDRSEAILDVGLDVAGRGEHVRSQFRGAIVEELTAQLLARRVPASTIHRERRILFDGVSAEIHPYDVTVELPERAEAYDCKWGARGINPEVILQLELARQGAANEGARLTTVLVIFDARLSCQVRLARLANARAIRLVTIETLDALAGVRPEPAT